MASKLLKLFVGFSVLSSLYVSSNAQTCQNYKFSSNQVFSSCQDLPYLNSFLHWTYDQSSGKLQMAYRHKGVTSSTWVAWAINPSGLQSAMFGAQSLVAHPQSSGEPKVYKSPIQGYSTTLEEGNLTYNVSELTASYQNNEMVIFATWNLPTTMTTINQVWQAGPIQGSKLNAHPMDSANKNSKGTLNLLSGQSGSAGGSSTNRKRNVHGVINVVSWGILMPIGATIARYLKVFKSADPAWFYLHVACQTSAYIVGVAGWGTGLKLGSDSSGIVQSTHRNIGIALFCLGTLQVFALLLRPKKDHKYRFYWNIYHHSFGYAVIILSIFNIFKGFDILQPADKWKRAYTGLIIALGVNAVLLEVFTWIVVLKRRRSESKESQGVNGTTGYGGRA